MMYMWLIIGFVLLIKGADYFVEGSSSVAKLLRVPSVIIGLTVVAFGTSAPEAAVSITASVMGNNEIAVGNVIGSNIFNLLVVLGTCGAMLPLMVDKNILYGDFLFSIFTSAVLLVLLAFDHELSRLDGMLLLMLFLYFLFSTVKSALKTRVSKAEQAESLTSLQSGVYILAGLAAIVFGGDFVVDSASKIAAEFGLSQTLIGLTIVAAGTSLPELVTSMVASRKGENGLALGNAIGSNIFNILLVLGSSSVISPLQVGTESVYDLMSLIAVSLMVWVLSRTSFKINRVEGIAMVGLYVAYIIYIIIR